ncbi:MAG TPA: leucyl/phenylalanyl-tRNA--protein transferase [Polyangiaceae bacterium]|jgi:leucyl/phenylalanyl-tRNA--protein transferase
MSSEVEGGPAALTIIDVDLDDARDAAALIEILDACAKALAPIVPPLSEEAKGGAIAGALKARGAFVLLARDGDENAGALVCVPDAGSLGGAPLTAVHELAVAPSGDDHRRAAIGRRLLEVADERARALRPARPASLVSFRDAGALPPRVTRDALGDGTFLLGAPARADNILDAVRQGLFAWPMYGIVPWCSPEPRAVYPLDAPESWSRSLRRTLRQRPFRVTVDQAFARVVEGCADRERTWIDRDIVAAEEELHARGLSHSVEVWNTESGALVGGIYGIALGAAFFAESMFHREADASKVAFVGLVSRLRAADFRVMDVQILSPHLASLGCVEIPRAQYLSALDAALGAPRPFPKE